MLTQRQHDTYNFIVQYIQREGRSPLISEVTLGLGLASQGSVHGYIQVLVDQGLLERSVGRSRGLRLIEQESEQASERSVKLPVLGTSTSEKCLKVKTALF